MRRIILICIIVLALPFLSYSQSRIDSIFGKLDPQKWRAAVEKKMRRLEEKITARTIKTLSHLQKQEEKIYKKMLSTKDSAIAKQKLSEIQDKYASLTQQLKSPAQAVTAGNIKVYLPYLDSVNSAFKLLNGQGKNLTSALSKVQGLEGRLQQTEQVKNFIRERREQLKQQLEQLGLVKQLKQFNKRVYYYSAQVQEYKDILNDPKKIEKKALELLSKTKIYKDFMQKNSMLASLFRLPGNDDDLLPQALAGLQTRTQVNNIIQQQVAAGGPNAQAQLRQNIQQAQNQLQQLKNKITEAGANSSDADMPDFKPNSQKTKSFLKRLEYGTNVQTQKANNFFPVTSDIGLSLGYKINDKSIIGIGASYKLGWGKGWNNVALTQQGAGLRSYVDWKIKGSFWLSGGYEMNYRTAFNSIAQLKDLNVWQQSGLVGLSKVISLKTKFFKKTKLQLLWDFLSYGQVPRTQPIVFRIGYNFK